MPSTFPSDRAGSTNAELKASDSSSNPYLALGGLLAAGLDGVTRKLEPGEPVLVDPAPCPRVSGASAGSSGTRPRLRAALDQLEADAVLMPASARHWPARTSP